MRYVSAEGAARAAEESAVWVLQCALMADPNREIGVAGRTGDGDPVRVQCIDALDTLEMLVSIIAKVRRERDEAVATARAWQEYIDESAGGYPTDATLTRAMLSTKQLLAKHQGGAHGPTD